MRMCFIILALCLCMGTAKGQQRKPDNATLVEYRLKLQAALDAHIDTLSDVRAELVRHHCDKPFSPRPWRKTGKKGDCVKAAHILVALRQTAPFEQQERARHRIDSIWNVLQQGKSFAALAKECSNDKGTAHEGGVLPWIGKGQTVKRFEEQAFALQRGETSRPFLSEFGYHIVQVIDRWDNAPIDSLQALPEEGNPMEARRKAIHDSILVAAIPGIAIGRDVETDVKAQKAFFKKNKRRYAKPQRFKRHQAQVIADLKEAREKEWLEQLRRKYPAIAGGTGRQAQ